MARSLFLVLGVATVSLVLHAAAASAADCYVDSQQGNDSLDGTTEATAWASPAAIASSCTAVKFKRGSEFAVAKGAYAVDLMKLRNVKTLTNYGDSALPLPKFVKQREVSSGGMLQSFMGGVTIDGLYLAGSQSDAEMTSLASGICVMLGADSKLINSEITLCDIGIMTSGDNVLVQHNYVHDLFISVDGDPGIDPNAVGGAEGIFVNSSHVDVSYNSFINCTIPARWVSGSSKRCDGGATEVTVGYAGEVTDVKIHHNLSYNSCGFFEVSSMFQPSDDTGPYVKGKFTDSVFYDNVMVDSGWISLLQINNTKLSNVRWENNTIVHHDMGKDEDGTDLNDFGSSRILAIPFNSTSSGVTGGGEIAEGDIYWTNNLWYFDPKVAPYGSPDDDEFLKNIVKKNNLILTADPGFVDVTATTDPLAFDLVQGSQAIDAGMNLEEVTVDFLGRPAPVGTQDVGAFEYQGDSASGGASGTGGSSWAATGGTPAAGGTTTAGGTTAAGGSTASGGTTVAGGRSAAGGNTAAGGRAPTGGASAAGGSANVGGTTMAGGNTAAAGRAPTGGTDGTSTATGGTLGTAETGGDASGGTSGDADVPAPGATDSEAADEKGCGCVAAGSAPAGNAAPVGLLLALAGLGARRRRVS
jgi:MYXO-CTERM domain-containing protein